MKSMTLAALLITACFATDAFARGTHPCKAEHQTAKTACAADKHSKDCKAAHKAVKDCRVAHGLPVKEKNNPAGSNMAEPASTPANGQTPTTGSSPH